MYTCAILTSIFLLMKINKLDVGFIAITCSYYRVLFQLQIMVQDWKWKTATFFIISQHPLHFKICALHRYTRRRPKLVKVINHRKTMFSWPETCCCLRGIPISSIDIVGFYLVRNLFDSKRPCSHYCYYELIFIFSHSALYFIFVFQILDYKSLIWNNNSCNKFLWRIL